MKQWFCWLLALLLVLSLTGCGTAGNSSVREISSALSAAEEQIPESSASALESQPSSQPESAVEASPEAAGSGVLIAYFSWAQNAVLEEGVDVMTSPSVSDPGNVQQLAGWIQEETGGELFSIQVTDPYPSDWDACLERANQERGQDARPALVEPQVENLEQYGTVFLGYPNWLAYHKLIQCTQFA